jgi:hypothetical protein
MAYIYHLRMWPAAIHVLPLLMGVSTAVACAQETGAPSGFDERHVEFHNQDVRLAGSLLLPRSGESLLGLKN